MMYRTIYIVSYIAMFRVRKMDYGMDIFCTSEIHAHTGCIFTVWIIIFFFQMYLSMDTDPESAPI